MTEKKSPKKPIAKVAVALPTQLSAQDTSNWDDKAFTTPSGRDMIAVEAEKEKHDPNEIPDIPEPSYRKKQPKKNTE